MEETNNQLRSEIEPSFNKKIKEKPQQNKNTLINQVDQCVSTFQTVILQTGKDLVHQLVISTN